jgi:hypothetical protein
MQITAVKNYEQKNTAISGKLIKAVFASYVYVYIFSYKLVRWHWTLPLGLNELQKETVFSPGEKWPGRAAGHSAPHSVEVKNEWI